MVELGRTARSDAATAAILAALAGGGRYERYLAAQATFGSGDAAAVLRALADPTHMVRALAIQVVPLACDDLGSTNGAGNRAQQRAAAVVGAAGGS